MARRVGEVLEAYLDPPRPEARVRDVLVKLEPGAWTAARLAVALIDRLNAGGARVGLRPCDPAARALLGDAAASPEGGVRAHVWLSTREPTPRHDCVLALLPALERGALGHRSAGPDGREAIVGLSFDPRAPLPAGWLAALSPHEALRIALGDRSGEAFERAASAVSAWLAGARPAPRPRRSAASP